MLDRILGNQPIVIGDLILTEILLGFADDRTAQMALDMLRPITFVSMVGWTVAVRSAENYQSLRRLGITVRKTVDLWIGTYCIENGCPLLHNDRDFQPMATYLGLVCVETG